MVKTTSAKWKLPELRFLDTKPDVWVFWFKENKLRLHQLNFDTHDMLVTAFRDVMSEAVALSGRCENFHECSVNVQTATGEEHCQLLGKWTGMLIIKMWETLEEMRPASHKGNTFLISIALYSLFRAIENVIEQQLTNRLSGTDSKSHAKIVWRNFLRAVHEIANKDSAINWLDAVKASGILPMFYLFKYLVVRIPHDHVNLKSSRVMEPVWMVSQNLVGRAVVTALCREAANFSEGISRTSRIPYTARLSDARLKELEPYFPLVMAEFTNMQHALGTQSKLFDENPIVFRGKTIFASFEKFHQTYVGQFGKPAEGDEALSELRDLLDGLSNPDKAHRLIMKHLGQKFCVASIHDFPYYARKWYHQHRHMKIFEGPIVTFHHVSPNVLQKTAATPFNNPEGVKLFGRRRFRAMGRIYSFLLMSYCYPSCIEAFIWSDMGFNSISYQEYKTMSYELENQTIKEKIANFVTGFKNDDEQGSTLEEREDHLDFFIEATYRLLRSGVYANIHWPYDERDFNVKMCKKVYKKDFLPICEFVIHQHAIRKNSFSFPVWTEGFPFFETNSYRNSAAWVSLSKDSDVTTSWEEKKWKIRKTVQAIVSSHLESDEEESLIKAIGIDVPKTKDQYDQIQQSHKAIPISFRATVVLVTTLELQAVALREISSCKYVGVDCEWHRAFCAEVAGVELVQVACSGHSNIVYVFDLRQLEPLLIKDWEERNGRSIEKDKELQNPCPESFFVKLFNSLPSTKKNTEGGRGITIAHSWKNDRFSIGLHHNFWYGPAYAKHIRKRMKGFKGHIHILWRDIITKGSRVEHSAMFESVLDCYDLNVRPLQAQERRHAMRGEAEAIEGSPKLTNDSSSLISLTELCRIFFGRGLSKDLASSNFRTRLVDINSEFGVRAVPHQVQVEYAALDALVLVKIFEKLVTMTYSVPCGDSGLRIARNVLRQLLNSGSGVSCDFCQPVESLRTSGRSSRRVRLDSYIPANDVYPCVSCGSTKYLRTRMMSSAYEYASYTPSETCSTAMPCANYPKVDMSRSTVDATPSESSFLTSSKVGGEYYNVHSASQGVRKGITEEVRLCARDFDRRTTLNSSLIYYGFQKLWVPAEYGSLAILGRFLTMSVNVILDVWEYEKLRRSILSDDCQSASLRFKDQIWIIPENERFGYEGLSHALDKAHHTRKYWKENVLTMREHKKKRSWDSEAYFTRSTTDSVSSALDVLSVVIPKLLDVATMGTRAVMCLNCSVEVESSKKLNVLCDGCQEDCCIKESENNENNDAKLVMEEILSLDEHKARGARDLLILECHARRRASKAAVREIIAS